MTKNKFSFSDYYRCSVFLIDKETKELVAEVFDGISTNSKEVCTKVYMSVSV